MDKEAIARIIDPKGWEYHDDHLRRAEKWEAEGKPADHALVGGYRNHAAYNVAESLAKASDILALQSSERGEGLREAVKAKRRALGWSLRDLEAETGIGFSTLARFERGERIGNRVRAHLTEWATLSPAEPSPESREGVEYVIWSNEHRSWWAPNRCGYTSSLERAGRYDRVEAIGIAHSARGGWNMAKQAEKNPPEIAMPLADALAQDAKAPAHD